MKDRVKTPEKILPVLQPLLLTDWEKMRDDLKSFVNLDTWIYKREESRLKPWLVAMSLSLS